MRVLIDINHPQHVHCFRFFIHIMKSKGHEVVVISRDKEIEHKLLDFYNIPYIDRGKGQKSLAGKFFYFFKAVYIIFKNAAVFKPDIILSFGTPYPAIVGWLLRIPHVSFNDTEFAKLHHMLTDPFSKCIITPSCYKHNLGKKHIRFRGLFELCYLHNKYFNPDESILKILGLNNNEKFVIIRFVSWNALHDMGLQGISDENKIRMVNVFSKFAQVFITSENDLPEELEKYKLHIPVNRIHDALSYASLLLGESATMAAESAVLGTPAIYLDEIGRGYTDELESKYHAVWNFSTTPKQQQLAIEKGVEIIKDSSTKIIAQEISEKIKKDSADFTSLMVWFVENFPQSINILKDNPDSQIIFN